MVIEKRPSPHFRKGRRAGMRAPSLELDGSDVMLPDAMVIHYISAINIDKDDPFNVDKVLDLLIKPIPIGGGKSVKVSSHYAIDRDGAVYQLVDDLDVAWHAGKSKMPDGRNYRGSCNEFSIGIELFGGNWIDFTDAQYDSLVDLTKQICSNYRGIKKKTIVGHDTIAPGRKVDPGKRFDWDRYFAGAFPTTIQTSDALTRKAQATDSEMKFVQDTCIKEGQDFAKVPPKSNITSGEQPSLCSRIKAILLGRRA
jgi:hypothetical protein